MKRNIKNIVVHSIKFPEGEFTHSELARFNRVSNQTVWQRYLKARQTGQIVSVGKRAVEKAKGSPSLLWRVNPNWTMALMVVKPRPGLEVTETTFIEPATAPQVAPQVAEVASVVSQDELQAELQAALA